MSKPIVEYWPSYYEDIKDFVELAQTEDAELQLSREAIDQLFDDQFVMTSSIEGIKRREKMLGIQADPSKETLDFRRKRIINRYSTKPPFTIRYLQERLDFLVGEERAVAAVDVQNFILTVTAAIENASVFREVERTIFAMKPANLVYQQQTGVYDSIGLQEHISMQTMVPQTILGLWELDVSPFYTLEPEVIIK